MLGVMAGPDIRDPLTIAREKPDFTAAARPETSLSGLRIGWRPRLGNEAVACEVLTACETALAALADMGADITEVTIPFENPERVWFVVNGSYRMAQFGHHLKQHRDIMCPTFVRQMDRITSYSAAELYDAIFQRTRLYREVQSWFANCDVVATPTLARAAVPIDQDFFGPIEIDSAQVENIRAAWYPYTMPFNLAGNPAVSLPAGFDSAGMPLAIQFIASGGDDSRLLRLAATFEQVCPWAHRTPAAW
jgi:aspartyl-tRNA(Asn)/glutamyl-tRNA(Gln) amidotransferase subunit A